MWDKWSYRSDTDNAAVSWDMTTCRLVRRISSKVTEEPGVSILIIAQEKWAPAGCLKRKRRLCGYSSRQVCGGCNKCQVLLRPRYLCGWQVRTNIWIGSVIEETQFQQAACDGAFWHLLPHTVRASLLTRFMSVHKLAELLTKDLPLTCRSKLYITSDIMPQINT